jgi:hypothetical protein
MATTNDRFIAKLWPDIPVAIDMFQDKTVSDLGDQVTIRQGGTITEKDRRIYYQDIVYQVCNALDEIDGKQTGIICGTADEPNTNVADRMKHLVREMQLYKAAETLLDAVSIASNLSKDVKDGESVVNWVKRVIKERDEAQNLLIKLAVDLGKEAL